MKNKKLLITSALVLALGLTSVGFSTKASAAGFDIGGFLGFGHSSANVQASGDSDDIGGGMHHGMLGIFGTVTAVNGDTITVQSKSWVRPASGSNSTTPTSSTTTYTVDATNATVIKNQTTSSVSAIAVGDIIMVQGTVNGTSVTATKINDGVMQRAPGVFGTVTAISGDTITVQSKGFGQNATATIYSVDATNATITKDNATSAISDIAVGDTVMVQGTVNGTSVTATKINDGVVMRSQPGSNGGATIPEGNGQPIIGGKVTAVSGDTITITNSSNTSYTIDATNAKITKGNTTETVSSIAVGDNVLAQGTINGTSVTAVTVVDSPATSTTGGGTSHPGFFGAIGSFFTKLFGF